MSAFIYNVKDAAEAGHLNNVTRVHTDGRVSRAFVRPGAPSADRMIERGGILIVTRTDGLHNIYVRGELRAVSETASAALAYADQIASR